MRPKDSDLAKQLDVRLRSFSRARPLPGVKSSVTRHVLVEQILESIRRIKYISRICERDVSHLRSDPSSELFDPLRAAVFHKRQGRIDEAFWLVFLSVHFGKSQRTGWRLARDVYDCLGNGAPWNWTRTSSNPNDFRYWLTTHQATLHGGDGILRRFGNHRKYESLDGSSPNGTGAVVESYVNWVHPPRTHEMLIQEAQQQGGGDPRVAFDHLYHSMNDVARFGRTAKFDYLTMVSKLGLTAIKPGSPYIQGSTGPLIGSRLLFGGSKTAALSSSDLDSWSTSLALHLDVDMQVMEDALCNWQKSPDIFRPFRG